MPEGQTSQVPSAADIAMALRQGIIDSGMVIAPADPKQSRSQVEQLYESLSANENTDKDSLAALKQLMDAQAQDLGRQQQEALDKKSAEFLYKLGVKNAEASVRSEIDRAVVGDEFLSGLRQAIEDQAFRVINSSPDYKALREEIGQGTVRTEAVGKLVKEVVEGFAKLDKSEKKSKGLAGMQSGFSGAQAENADGGEDSPKSVDDLNSAQKDWYYERVMHNRRFGMKREEAEKAAMKSTLSVGLLQREGSRSR